MDASNTPLTDARRRDTKIRMDRVERALEAMLKDGGEITVSAVAREAKVHRTFIYRHPAAHAAVMKAAERSATPPTSSGRASIRSVQAENLNLRDANTRLRQTISDLEAALARALGDQAFKRTGFGAPPDHEQLRLRAEALELEVRSLKRALEERTDDLDAARATSRQLMVRLNSSSDTEV